VVLEHFETLTSLYSVLETLVKIMSFGGGGLGKGGRGVLGHVMLKLYPFAQWAEHLKYLVCPTVAAILPLVAE
jgi:hypothetical protein